MKRQFKAIGTRFKVPVLALVITGFAITMPAQTVPAASCALSDVQATVNSAARGGTVTVPGGSCSWNGTLTLSKGVTLQGAGSASTIILNNMGGNSPHISISPGATAIANEETIRVTGFTLDGNNGTGRAINLNGASGSNAKPWRYVIIDHNTFRNYGSQSGDGCIYMSGQTRGVIYANTFDRCDSVLRPIGDGSYTEWQNPALNPANAYGTADNLYVEDNVIQFSSSYTSAGGNGGTIQAEQGGRIAFRFNKLNYANLTNQGEVFDAHGNQYCPGNSCTTSTMVVEYYDNSISGAGLWRIINHRGSRGMYFDNSETGGNVIIESDQYQGGCTSDIPSPNSPAFPVEINDTYVWNNTSNGSIIPMQAGSYTYCGVAENASWWNYNASFNGTTGVGRGPKSGMPVTCTKGVAYWVTDEGSWNTKLGANTSGQLYKCVSTNVWQLYYVPLTYPHPLRSGGSTSGSPGSPTGLTAVAQ